MTQLDFVLMPVAFLISTLVNWVVMRLRHSPLPRAEEVRLGLYIWGFACLILWK